ncbi:MAG: hypothetical protein OEV80_11570, partial [candidate division Zixibacteria bacterium]|nr:hypothetical protein [candidate division Zixibacteria bacterium]
MKLATRMLLVLILTTGSMLATPGAALIDSDTAESMSTDLIPRVTADKSSAIPVSSQAVISHVVVKFAQSSGVRLRGNRLISLTTG